MAPAAETVVRLRERGEALTLAAALALPSRAQRALAGTPIQRDGQRLSTETQLMLRLQELGGVTPVEELDWAEGRRELDRQSGLVGGRQRIGAVRDFAVPGPAGSIPVRLYTPSSRRGQTRIPTLLFIHGGGMTYGSLDGHDAAARHLSEHSGVQLLSVDYRLAPEHPYPAAVEDNFAAYRWLVDNAASIGADRERLAVGGDSAGGYLSATTAILAAREGLPLHFQLLVYPCTDFVNRSRSRQVFGEGFFLSNKFIDQCTEAFFPTHADRADGSVISWELPAGLAKAYVVTAGFDPLRDEGEAYAVRLRESGVDVEMRRYPSMIHGFFNAVGVGREAPSYNRQIAARLAAEMA